METFISEQEIYTRIKRYRESLPEDERTETNFNILGLKEHTRAKLQDKLTASQRRAIRYGAKYEALKAKRS